jgi:Protein of unknown function (DUF3298)
MVTAADSADRDDRPPPRRLRIPVALRLWLGFLFIAPLVGIVGILTPRTTVTNDTYALYEGRVGNEHAWLHLGFKDDWCLDHLLIGDDREYSFVGTNQSPLHFREVRRQQRRLWHGLPENELVLEFADGPRQLHGVWINTAKERQTVEFVRKMSGRTLVRTLDALWENRGRRIVYEATYPVLSGDSRFEMAVQRELEAQIHQLGVKATATLWHDWNDFCTSVRGEYGAKTWSHHSQWRVVMYDSEFIALIGERYADTGGAHGNFSFETLNWFWDGQRARRVELRDFFDDRKDWRPHLARCCRDELVRLQASDAAEVERDPELLENFVLTSQGFRFCFRPYRVGCFAEGSFEVVVPFADVQTWLGTTGPGPALRQWLARK